MISENNHTFSSVFMNTYEYSRILIFILLFMNDEYNLRCIQEYRLIRNSELKGKRYLKNICHVK